MLEERERNITSLQDHIERLSKYQDILNEVEPGSVDLAGTVTGAVDSVQVRIGDDATWHDASLVGDSWTYRWFQTPEDSFDGQVAKALKKSSL